MSETKTARLGYWKTTFRAGIMELECPMVLDEVELECFNGIMDLIRRQVNRWSKEAAEKNAPNPTTETEQ